MSEDVEIPKGEDKPESPQQTTSVDPHKENFTEAIERAQEATDERTIEAAGEKAGLRGALAARMDAMNKHLDNIARTRITSQKGILGSLNPTMRTIDTIAGRPTARLGVKVTGMLRDRLKPAASKTSSKQSK